MTVLRTLAPRLIHPGPPLLCRRMTAAAAAAAASAPIPNAPPPRPTPRLSAAGKTKLDALLAREVDSRRVPAIFFGATTADGPIYWAHRGDKEFGSPEQVGDDTVLQLFSQTKFVTSVALLKLVDQGLVSLDDPDILDKHIPEVSKQDILTGYTDDGPVHTPRRTRLTLRMLLSHTSGLGYAATNPLVRRWQKENGAGRKGDASEYLGPLAFEPRTRWRYGTGIDWAGVLLERITGQRLGAWMQENIFEPCGITSITFDPVQAKPNLMTLCYRDAEGDITIPAPQFRPAGGLYGGVRQMDPAKRGIDAGGGGLFGTAKDYLIFLEAVLGSRVGKPTRNGSTPLLERESFDEIFTSSLPPRGPDNRCYADCAKIMLATGFTDPAHTSGGTGDGLAHSVALMLNTMDSVHGRRAGSGCWDGAAKSEFWIDPESGIAAVCCTQLSATNPDYFMKVYNMYERALYDGLE